ncbi:Dynein beta chain ciliary [Gryllus bimaculatus]|nr:Dynein beta chain ciliary [Gryllus bimaculatus]
MEFVHFLSYISENMDPANNYAPLFEAQLELQEPDLVFIPSLNPEDDDSFSKLIDSIIQDILKMASLVPRISQGKEAKDYQTEIENNEDIQEMRKEIFEAVQKVLNEAQMFSEEFENYSYLWLDDRESYMQQFLDYGRQLSLEDQEKLALEGDNAIPFSSPTLEAFKEQIDQFESLYAEVEVLESMQVFNCWFQLDVRPCKHALLNTVCKWGSMFKQHLVDHVTSR